MKVGTEKRTVAWGLQLEGKCDREHTTAYNFHFHQKEATNLQEQIDNSHSNGIY